MRIVILHHHIYKNAGTTVSHILEKNFGAGFSSIHDADAGGAITRQNLVGFLENDKNIKALTSHHFHTREFIPYDAPDFDGKFALIDLVLIRHPILRLISMYDFLRRGGGGDSDKTEQAIRLGLRNWLEMLLETEPGTVNNAQVGILSRFGYYASPPSVDDLETALRRLKRFAVIGTVEAFDQFCVCAEYFLQPAFGKLDFAHQVQNAHTQHKRVRSMEQVESLIGSSLFSVLYRVNRLDLELWAATGIESARRFDEIYRRDERLMEFRERSTHHGLGATHAVDLPGEILPEAVEFGPMAARRD